MDGDARRGLGAASAVAGLLSLFGSFMIAATSGMIANFDPPGGLRIPLMLLFPVGLLAAPALAAASWKTRSRVLGVIGLVAAGAALALFVWAIISLQ